MDWDPARPNQRVRLRDNPGRQGMTTGELRQTGDLIYVRVTFGPNERSFKLVDDLEPCPEAEDIETLITQGNYGLPIDLRRVLTLEKVKGQLTNVFYSMETSNTDFYPHQFKPVLRFIESSVGRLLIADEVGLGKTIEAMYVWKELQARQDARRLLIICPAMLRTKWQDDLHHRFNIHAEIVDSNRLLEQFSGFRQRGVPHSFVSIASLEGLRPPADFDQQEKPSRRARVANILDQAMMRGAEPLLHLVIIDEAHYLRNPATANNRLGRLLRDAAEHLLLLTATPIQLGNENLFQLMRLINPEEFFDEISFEGALQANRPIVHAQRCLWRNPPALAEALDAVNEARQSKYFQSSVLLRRVAEVLAREANNGRPKLVQVGRMLEECSLLSQYMNRTRKREVLENRVERRAQVLTVRLNEMERSVYERVKENIANNWRQDDRTKIFSLVARLRQISSCMPAALQGWHERDLLPELLWEDLGVTLPGFPDVDDFDGEEPGDALRPDFERLFDPRDFDTSALEARDSKYYSIKGFLKEELQRNPGEKIVIFAFFRGTLKYLQRRLEADGIRTCLIMGGVDIDKWAVIEAFRQPEGPNILLSSEVGSEGIDLQFCRILVNYDLPWNPMRVEQRIGRLDRLGQQSPTISIVNLVLENTIEQKILYRLYDRINIFRESIGELENILGDMTDELILELFDPQLSEAELEAKALEMERTIENRRAIQEDLEKQAANLWAFSDYIMESIRDSRDKGRWLSPEELLSLVDDFFRAWYPGTVLDRQSVKPNTLLVQLSDEARTALHHYVIKQRAATPTQLFRTTSPVTCRFDPRRTVRIGQGEELIDPLHPLIQWIRQEYETRERRLHTVSAAVLAAADAGLPRGLYTYLIQIWRLKGLYTENRLAYQVIRAMDDTVLSADAAEALILLASRQGQPHPNPQYRIEDPSPLLELIDRCRGELLQAFTILQENFKATNQDRCNLQEQSVRAYAERKRTELTERLARYRREGTLQIIPATEGLLKKVEHDYQLRMEQIREKRGTECGFDDLAAGVIFIE